MYGLLRIFFIHVYIYIYFYFILSYCHHNFWQKGSNFYPYLNYNSRLKKVNVVYTVNFIPVNPNITILSFFCNEPYDWIATYDFYYLIVLNDFTFFFKSRTVLISFCTKCNSFSKLSSSIYWVFLQALFYLYKYVYIMRFVK